MSSKCNLPKARSVRKRKRRFRGNKYVKQKVEVVQKPLNESYSSSEELEEVEADLGSDTGSEDLNESATARKLNLEANSSDEEDLDQLNENQEGFRLIDIDVLNNEMSSFCVCSSCKCGKVELFDLNQKKKGYASCLILRCSNCKIQKEFYTSKKPSAKERYKVNTRMVVGMRIGRGREAMNKLSEVLNIPKAMGQSSFDLCMQDVVTMAKDIADESMKSACEEVKEYYEPDDNDNYPIAVSCDGTWPTRGYSSRYGVYGTMSLVTGKVLDFHIMSKYCKACVMKGDKMDNNSREFRRWKLQHESQCEKNYEGSSPAMETEGAKVVFHRSEEKGLQYVEFLGDGDSKGYEEAKKVVDYDITKVDCINHVSKRMGGSLRELKKKGKSLSDGKGWGGRRRLTDPIMNNMPKYYYRAIKNNLGNVEATRKAVLAIMYHRASTDDKPQHEYCSNVWCGYLKDKESYTTDKDKIIPHAIVEAIKPTFQRLSDPLLLERCSTGKTQNQNESLHGVIWSLCPKEDHVGLDTVKLAVYMAVSLFNDGERSVSSLLQSLNVPSGLFHEVAVDNVDKMRMYHAERKFTESFKRRRTALKNRRRGFEKKKKQKEGRTYGAGLF